MDTSSSEFGIFVSGEAIVKSERMPAQSSLLPHATTIRLRSQVGLDLFHGRFATDPDGNPAAATSEAHFIHAFVIRHTPPAYPPPKKS